MCIPFENAIFVFGGAFTSQNSKILIYCIPELLLHKSYVILVSSK